MNYEYVCESTVFLRVSPVKERHSLSIHPPPIDHAVLNKYLKTCRKMTNSDFFYFIYNFRSTEADV